MLSLLTCLLEDRLPKAVSYVYQIAALVGFGHLIIGRDFLAIFGDYMRFWYCFFYLIVALANIIAVGIYLAVLKRQWTLARVWSSAIAFPATMFSLFFVYEYGLMQGAVFHLALQISLLVSAVLMGISICAFFSPEIVKKVFGMKKEVRDSELEKDSDQETAEAVVPAPYIDAHSNG